MLVLLLATQVAAAPLAAETPKPAEAPSLRPAGSVIRVIRALPSAACLAAGRMEVSWTEPAALYRHGDRPPKVYLRWNDYPDGQFCRAGGVR